MFRRRPPRPPARNKSGIVSRALRAESDRLEYLSALDSQGALLRIVLAPTLRILAAGLGWWSHSWIGQVLGLGWIRTNFMLGMHNRLDPREVGDDWPTYKDGNVKRQ